MKYGFSTLVCPGWEWDEVISAASDLGFDGVELRGLGKHIDITAMRLFTTDTPAADLARTGLSIPCLSTGACLADARAAREALAEAEAYIALAARLGTPYIRVLGDRDPAPDAAHTDEALLRENLSKLLPLAMAKGVTLLIETNGVYADSARLARLLAAVDSPALGVLWDVHHPYRYGGEKPAQTHANLAPYIRHVHVKDSVMDKAELSYRMLGFGDVPLREALAVLRDSGYDGFVVLEWVKRWNMALEEPGIVLPHFLGTVKKL